MIRRQPYQQPKPAYKSGRWVEYQGMRWRVEHSTHTHSQLLGLEKAVPNWLLKPTSKPKVISITK